MFLRWLVSQVVCCPHHHDAIVDLVGLIALLPLACTTPHTKAAKSLDFLNPSPI